jgi:hypothetical protein
MNKLQIISKTAILCLVSFCSLNGLDWYYDTSIRIEALGIDFAGVLADRQTDIDIRNPAYLEGYKAIIVTRKGYNYSLWSGPLNLYLFYNHFGLMFRHRGHYFLNTDPTYPKNQLYQFNLSGYWTNSGFGLQYDFYMDDQKLEYITSTATTQKENFTFHNLTIGYRPRNHNNLDLRCRLSLGSYDSVALEFIGSQLAPVRQTEFLIPSAQIGLSYERSFSEKNSFCLLIDLGGPASGFEAKRLPTPFQSTIERNEYGEPKQFAFFANSFSSRVAGTFSFYPDKSILFALGVNNFWSGAKIRGGNPGSVWFNTLVLPLAFEWQSNEVIAIRAGIRALYYYHYLKQEKTVINSYWLQSQSFGLGFKLYPSWYLDLAILNNILQIESFNLSLRKEL